jgi:hypothetical protein
MASRTRARNIRTTRSGGRGPRRGGQPKDVPPKNVDYVYTPKPSSRRISNRRVYHVIRHRRRPSIVLEDTGYGQTPIVVHDVDRDQPLVVVQDRDDTGYGFNQPSAFPASSSQLYSSGEVQVNRVTIDQLSEYSEHPAKRDRVIVVIRGYGVLRTKGSDDRELVPGTVVVAINGSDFTVTNSGSSTLELFITSAQ